MRQMGRIAFGSHAFANAEDGRRLASNNGVVFHFAIDLIERENAVVIVVPAVEMFLDKLV